MRFKKIPETQVDPRRVTVRLLAGEDGSVRGQVSTLAYGATGIELMSTAGSDPPIETALELAKQLAAFKEEDVDVVDPQALWRAEWGDLDEQ